MLADYHTHTAFSGDSAYPMEDVVRDAIRLHLDEICITDHVDYGIKDDWDSGRRICYRNEEPLANVDYPRWAAELARIQKRYGEKIAVRAGMEFGVQVHTIPQFESLFQQYPFDFIILSVHQVEDKEFWTQDFQKGRTQREYNERYYGEMLSVIRQFKHYSVLGHMDLIKRYDREGPYPFDKIRPMAAEILKTVIADGRGIEVNTSARRYGLDDSMPSRELLKLYRDLGGTILTIGSDSHAPAHLGNGIREAQKQLKELGFTHFCTFEKMEPVFRPL